jgi:glucan phosphoethanolaminetransferase (alkaline phosphatase superfamily)
LWSFIAACAFLAPRRFGFSIAASIFLLPASLWFLGFAALNGIGPDASTLLTIPETNPEEAAGALKTTLEAPGYITAALSHVLLIALSTVFHYKSRKTAPARFLRTVGFVSILPLITAPVLAIPDAITQSSMLTSDAALITGGANLVYDDYEQSKNTIAAPPEILAKAKRDSEEIKSTSALSLGRRPADATPATGKLITVFVIGEASRYDRLNKNAALKDAWAKVLDERTSQNLGAFLPPVCSSADGTTESIPLIVTGLDPAERDDQNKAPTGLGRLKAAGFKTAWLGNNSLDNPKSKHRDGADEIWVGHEQVKTKNDWPMDEVLQKPFAERVAKADGNLAIVLHLQGTHAGYGVRFPKSFTVADKEMNSEKNYDLASSYVAKQLADTLAVLDKQDTPAVLVYVPDHGENLKSDDNGLLFHLNARQSKAATTVPAYVAWNKAFARQRTPQEIIGQDMLTAPMLAHKDVFALWMSLSKTGETAHPTQDPHVWGSVELGGKKSAISCSSLKP